MTLTPAAGEWKGGVFRFPIRVFYEDTDIGGMTYHARYVSFFERTRSESIRGTAADVDALFAIPAEMGGPFIYVVRSVNITYHRQSTVGDVLIGHCQVIRVRAAAVEIKQWITLESGELVAEGHVSVAIVGKDGRPKRWPAATRATWENWLRLAD